MSFIFTDEEYENAKKMLSKSDEFMATQKQEWENQGFEPREVKRLADSSFTYLIMAKEDLEIYENLKAGNLPAEYSLEHFGRLLTCARIAKGVSREELAARLHLDPKVVARNERNEYYGVSFVEAQRVLDALGVSVTVRATLG